LVIGGTSLRRKLVTGRNFNFFAVNAMYGAPLKKRKGRKKKKKKTCPTSSEIKVIPMKTEKYFSLVRNIHALFKETTTR